MIYLAIIYCYKKRCISARSLFGLFFFFLQGFTGQSYGNSSVLEQEIRQYCTGIADLIREHHYLLHKKVLEDLQREIEQRVKVLENHKNEYVEWFKKYEDFIASYDKNILDIYKKMNSDSAAAQLENINPEISSHILMQLSPRRASSIMSKMNPKSAAMITDIIARILKFQKPKRSE
ncbi:MAG: hypothetical protein EU981_00695 [Candidatus Liberibacter ctenarytainae]|uniref:Magnesium transporter MgtE intracellular domain-containing protein n=1 Tax=Candidatus Liberibacter ctenarytainae TaxID=2020335 RepID=A0A937AE07_9HYPH|nr:hypothetical protein [Candidatus Liberibacter ctenarytainae]